MIMSHVARCTSQSSLTEERIGKGRSNIHQNRILSLEDNLWLCELMRYLASFEDQAVLQHKLLEAARCLHSVYISVQHLKSGTILSGSMTVKLVGDPD